MSCAFPFRAQRLPRFPPQPLRASTPRRQCANLTPACGTPACGTCRPPCPLHPCPPGVPLLALPEHAVVHVPRGPRGRPHSPRSRPCRPRGARHGRPLHRLPGHHRRQEEGSMGLRGEVSRRGSWSAKAGQDGVGPQWTFRSGYQRYGTLGWAQAASHIVLGLCPSEQTAIDPSAQPGGPTPRRIVLLPLTPPLPRIALLRACCADPLLP